MVRRIQHVKFGAIALCMLIAVNSCRKDDAALSGTVQRREDQIALLIADFAFSPSICSTPVAIDFQNESKNATSFDWDFGDGANSIEVNPHKTYQQSGDYQVRLTAHAFGRSAEVTKTITVLVTKGAGPVAKFEVAINPQLKTEISITNQSVNADSYFWNFGDGSLKYMTTSLEFVHQYPGPGVYTVTLTASNSNGGNCITVPIDINP
jgi:PKD repeat protein